MEVISCLKGGKIRMAPNLLELYVSMKSILILLAVLLPSCVLAQTNERIYEELDFRFVTPGARAIGMGKTFVGLADDATAACSNPAGLSNLLEQELSFELITTDIDHHRFIPSDTRETQAFGDRVYTPSFFSYGIPHKNFTFSFFRNVVQDYKETFEFTGRFIPSINKEESGYFGKLSIDSENYGVGVSYLFHPRISVGASLVLSHVDVDAEGRTGNRIDFRNGTNTKNSDTAAGAIIGVLIKPFQKLSFGAVYNTGTKFELETTLIGRFRGKEGVFPDLTGKVFPIDYVIPDRFSLGLAYRFGDHLTAAFDATRIRYSKRITENFLILEPFLLFTKENYSIRDVTELHVGAEYRFYSRQTFAIRGGLFTDPDHALRFNQFSDDDFSLVEAFRFNSLPQSTDLGFTFGGGVAFANRLQLDSAFSFSPDAKEISISCVLKL